MTEPRIMPRLMEGARSVCADCRRVIPLDAPKVTVPNPGNPKAPWWRCADCEYKRAETRRWEAEHLIPKCPPWLDRAVYVKLAELRQSL